MFCNYKCRNYNYNVKYLIWGFCQFFHSSQDDLIIIHSMVLVVDLDAVQEMMDVGTSSISGQHVGCLTEELATRQIERLT